MAMTIDVARSIPSAGLEAMAQAPDTDAETKALSIKVLMERATLESGEATLGGVTMPLEFIEAFAVLSTLVLNKKDYTEGGKQSGAYIGERQSFAKLAREAWVTMESWGGARSIDKVEARLAAYFEQS